MSLGGRKVFFPYLTPKDDPVGWINCVDRLMSGHVGGGHVLVNAFGWVKGLGLEMTLTLIERLKPKIVWKLGDVKGVEGRVLKINDRCREKKGSGGEKVGGRVWRVDEGLVQWEVDGGIVEGESVQSLFVKCRVGMIDVSGWCLFTATVLKFQDGCAYFRGPAYVSTEVVQNVKTVVLGRGGGWVGGFAGGVGGIGSEGMKSRNSIPRKKNG
ncbi:hypothetical protein TrST_g2451 [Triparma strigata]|uniref:Uncharacterized protein n=1 Tax=Triparma strigata TaxID=1606541 RepID=A0A9W7BS40_9STRA|nr:hypothetical protein TrST_g2451 [Triparma strigata]